MRPHIGSHPSIAEQAHLWHFARTMPRGSPPFAKTRYSAFLPVWLAFAAGLLAGLGAWLIGYWIN